MNNILLLNLKETDHSFKIFCLDLFDEKPVDMRELLPGGFITSLSLIQSKLGLLVTFVIIKFLRCILVKKYTAKNYEIKYKTIANKISNNFTFVIYKTERKFSLDFCKIKDMFNNFSKNFDISLGFT